MTDIPNAKYITIKRDDKGRVGVLVGEQPVTEYRGEKIRLIDEVQEYFADIQKLNPNVVELHVLSSETRGEYAVVGNPSGKYGPNVWCRVKFNDGRIGSWVFVTRGSAADCAYYCAYRCAVYVRAYASFRSAVFGEKDKQNAVQKTVKNPLKNALQNVDLSECVGKPVQLNGYEIVVKKIAEHVK